MKKLTRDHLIDGQVYSKGTEYEIQEGKVLNEDTGVDARFSEEVLKYIYDNLAIGKSAFKIGQRISLMLVRLGEHQDNRIYYNHSNLIDGLKFFFDIDSVNWAIPTDGNMPFGKAFEKSTNEKVK